MKVIENGCSSDDVIVSNVKYAENHNSAFADAMVSYIETQKSFGFLE